VLAADFLLLCGKARAFGAVEYLRGWFWVDLISAIPFECP
jgi:hypothetical protein